MKPRVTMLVTNPVRRDNRVLKEARVLRDAGYQVTIVGTVDPNYPDDETVDGVRIRLVNPDVRHRYRRGRAYQERRSAAREALLKIKDRIHAIIPEGNPLALHLISVLLRKSALAPFSIVHRLTQESMASAHRLESALLWKLEPFVRLHDYSEAVFDIADEIEADVWHAHDLDTMPTALALRGAFGGRVIYDAHEYWLDCNNEYSTFARVAWEEIEREVTPEADAVVTVSRSIAKVLAEKYGVDEPDVVLNAPTYERAEKNRVLRDRLRVNDDQFLVIYVGLVTVGRGYEVLFEALSRLPDVVLAVLGPGLESYKDGLKALAAKIGIADRVHFLDPVPYREIQHLSAGADAGLVVVQRDALSYELCLPSKFFEYVFAGIPVGVSDLPELRPVVEKYGIGVCFDERDPVSVAAGIRALQATRDAYRGKDWDDKVARVAAAYDWEVRKQDLLDVYAKLGVVPEVRA